MLPGKTFTPEEVIRLARKRVWVILLPLALVAAGATVVVKRMPDYYRAETVILVIPQSVPDSYVRPTVTTGIGDRLRTISPTIRSRSRLERLIQEFDLYPDERRAMPMESVVQIMDDAIDVQTVREDAFYVRYVGRDPRKVMEVTNRLASMYIEESVAARRDQADQTDEFLESRLAETKMRLQLQEQRLAAYRRDHAAELPSQMDSNQQQVMNAQAQVRAQIETIGKLQDRRLLLERELTDLETGGSLVTTEAGAGAASLADQLETAEENLAAARRAYHPTHPDIRVAERIVKELMMKLQSQRSADAANQSQLSAVDLARRRRVTELRDQIAEVDKQIKQAAADQARYQELGDTAQRRIDSLPTRETELTELMRDYSTVDDMYKNLLEKKEESRLAASLERKPIGERFQLLDEARLPERPFSPDRQRLVLLASGFGFFIGLALVGMLEYRDKGLQSDRDVATVLSLPVLASIPLMRSGLEERRALLGRLAVDFGCGGLVAACAAFVAYSLVL